MIIFVCGLLDLISCVDNGPKCPIWAFHGVVLGLRCHRAGFTALVATMEPTSSTLWKSTILGLTGESSRQKTLHNCWKNFWSRFHRLIFSRFQMALCSRDADWTLRPHRSHARNPAQITRLNHRPVLTTSHVRVWGNSWGRFISDWRRALFRSTCHHWGKIQAEEDRDFTTTHETTRPSPDCSLPTHQASNLR